MHYRNSSLCRAGKRHGKGPRTHGNVFAVRRRTATSARQCTARQRILCRAFRQDRSATPLPCFVIFAVRLTPLPCARTLPCVLHRCHTRELCRAFFPLPCHISLPCVLLVAVPHFFAVRRTFAVPRFTAVRRT
jgi:hypothetical protein